MPELILGSALILLSRRLPFLFSAGVALLLSRLLFPVYLPGLSGLVQWALAVAAAVVVALLTLLAARLSLAVFGALGALYAVITLEALSGLTATLLSLYATAGLLGAFLMLLATDWALMLLGSLVGAVLVMQRVALPPLERFLLVLVLVVVGVALQSQIGGGGDE